jgi:hypothetical protein
MVKEGLPWKSFFGERKPSKGLSFQSFYQWGIGNAFSVRSVK